MSASSKASSKSLPHHQGRYANGTRFRLLTNSSRAYRILAFHHDYPLAVSNSIALVSVITSAILILSGFDCSERLQSAAGSAGDRVTIPGRCFYSALQSFL